MERVYYLKINDFYYFLKGIFDVSNKRRLGYSEASLARDMYNGVNELIEIEKSL